PAREIAVGGAEIGIARQPPEVPARAHVVAVVARQRVAGAGEAEVARDRLQQVVAGQDELPRSVAVAAVHRVEQAVLDAQLDELPEGMAELEAERGGTDLQL